MKPSTLSYDVIILGAGAAGLLCAITAAKRGRQVLVLESANKVGKKILMSGGGRCNFTNHFVEADNYLSGNPHFCKSALSRFTQWDFIALVEKHGIDYEERKHGQLFCKHSAKDILNMLLDECEQVGVEIRTHCVINRVAALEEKQIADEPRAAAEQLRYGVELTQKEKTLSPQCHSLVIATGALSIPSLGGSGIGYDIAQQFSLAVTERRAGLVPFMFSDFVKPLCERLAGSSLETTVSCNKKQFTEKLLFTHRGMSGPVVLQISNYWLPGDEIHIDLLPETDTAEWLLSAKTTDAKSKLKNLLGRKLPKALVSELQALWWPESADQSIARYTDNQLTDIANRLKHWTVKPSATEGYRTAEVTLGGVDCSGISSKTMETKNQAGLYFIGEVLDVTGHLGGYNFQWSWSSAYSAGLYV